MNSARKQKKWRVRQVKVLEHPDIYLALRTGYPSPIKPVEPFNPALEVGNDEFAEIISQRLKKERENVKETQPAQTSGEYGRRRTRH
jgi:hypothetical protein